jgi:hypothetical protein
VHPLFFFAIQINQVCVFPFLFFASQCFSSPCRDKSNEFCYLLLFWRLWTLVLSPCKEQNQMHFYPFLFSCFFGLLRPIAIFLNHHNSSSRSSCPFFFFGTPFLWHFDGHITFFHPCKNKFETLSHIDPRLRVVTYLGLFIYGGIVSGGYKFLL